MPTKFRLKASEEKKDFFDLIGTTVTFASDILSWGGQITHQKGQKAVISDVIYSAGHYGAISSMWIKPKITEFKIDDTCLVWRPDTFEEWKNKSLQSNYTE